MKKVKLADKKFYPWFIWGLAAGFYAYRYLLEVSPGVMVSDLMGSLSVTAAELGNLAAFFLYAYAGMQILVGVLLDRFGARRLLTNAAIVSGLGILIFGNAANFFSAAFGRLLCGLGSSFTAVGCLFIASKWLPPNRFALATGLILTVGMAGAIGGSAPLALLVAAVGWRSALFILSVVGFVIALLLWIFIKDKVKGIIASITPKKKEHILTGLKYVVVNKQSWLLAIYGGLIFMTVSIFGSLWGVPFLIQKYNCSNSYAATLIIMLFVGLAFGSPIFGWLSDHIGKRKSIMYISSFGTTLSVVLLLYLPQTPQIFAGIFLFSFGFFTGASFVSYAAILENNQKNYSGSALGFMNVLNMVGGAIGQPIVGMILDWQWKGVLVNGVRYYSVVNYEVALTLLPLVLTLSIFFLPFIRETNCEYIS